MPATELLDQIGRSLGATATVKSVFGEPILSADKIVIPVAKVAFGFGGGFGSGHGKPETGDAQRVEHDGEGGGGGGGVRAFPAGALEITHDGTRFIPFPDVRLALGAFAAGALFAGILLGRQARR
jgi:uncharacterized spore protein YtfJ